MTTATPDSLAIRAAATLLPHPAATEAEVPSPISIAPISLGVFDAPDQLGGRIAPRVGREHAVGIGQQDEKARVQEPRHQRREEVVVAEGDLVGRGRVVLVDDRHHPPIEQPPQGLAGVQIVGACRDVGRG